ncbi:MAG TPA: hypothetical protein VGR16_09670, partial [Thermomicrobiales bacterium]|nr:hypothetical protein [Thermomicrobiales bacterium]
MMRWRLSHTLGLAVAAGGIETEQHGSGVRALGINHGQGYYFGGQRSADEVPSVFLTTERAETKHDGCAKEWR